MLNSLATAPQPCFAVRECAGQIEVGAQMTQDLRVPASLPCRLRASALAIRAAGDGWIQWLLTAAESQRCLI